MPDYFGLAVDLARTLTVSVQPSSEPSHWIEGDAPASDGFAIAACGTIVRAVAFSSVPDCQDCQRYLREIEAAA